MMTKIHVVALLLWEYSCFIATQTAIGLHCTKLHCTIRISVLPIKRKAKREKQRKKTIVSVKLLCLKCRQKVMTLIAKLEGIASIVIDPSKDTVTVIGEADPVKIIKKVREFRKSAAIVSVGPPKEEKKEAKEAVLVPVAPKACQRCDVWYVVGEDYYSYCSIL